MKFKEDCITDDPRRCYIVTEKTPYRGRYHTRRVDFMTEQMAMHYLELKIDQYKKYSRCRGIVFTIEKWNRSKGERVETLERQLV